MGKLFKSTEEIQYVRKENQHELVGRGTTSTVKKVYHLSNPSVVYAMKIMAKSSPEEIVYI